MARERYDDWLARGRTHLADARPIDAIVCLRHALRIAPRGAEARFHLGEAAWHLGRRDEAIAHWREAIAADPAHAAALHAVAEAHAAAGDYAAALQAIERVLTLRPGDRRAMALAELLRAADRPVFDPSRWPALVDALGDSIAWLAPLVSRIVRQIVSARPAAMPQDWDPWIDSLLEMPVVEGHEDALRTIALALTDAQDPRATQFAARYGDLCRRVHVPAAPLLWPRRTRGHRARIGVLAGGRRDRDALIEALAGVVAGERCEGTLLVDAGDARAFEGVAVRALPTAPDAATRAIATLDLDLLIDAAGLHAPTGPLVALRPARSLLGVALGDEAIADGLYDSVVRGDVPAIVAASRNALASLQHGLASQTGTAVGAVELSAQWDAAVAAHRRGDVPGAHEGYASTLAHQPEFAPAHFLKGVLARDGGSADDALAEFGAAVALAPEFVDARAALAGALLDRGDATGAATVARAGLARSARPALWRALGRAELARGDGAAAASAFSEALQRDPLDAETHYNQGVAFQMQRDAVQAARAYQRALALAPDLHAADYNLGVLFQQQGNTDAAVAAFRQVLAHAPRHVQAYTALSEALLAAGRLDEWFANFERFEASCPDSIALAAIALEIAAYRADYPAVERYLDGLRGDRFTAANPNELLDALQQLLFLLLYFDVETALVDRYARMHDRVSRDVYGEPPPRSAPRRPGKLRIGYLSGDFRNHVMGKMMWQALRHHDGERFETFGYSATDARDAWTERIAASFTHFESLGALSDRDAVHRIAGADLDVLVDLSTHTKGARPAILAAKPARVQITHIASAGTAAMSAIDFKLTDRYADRDDAEPAIEARLVMAGCVYPYRHIEPAERYAAERASLGLAPDAVVIGAFCTPLKLSRRCMTLWRDVLAGIPHAVLAFSPLNPGYRDAYVRIAAAAGVGAARLVFLPQGRDDGENQARYRAIDFVLDPLPYGGVNGTLEALDMGVPVVTLVGARHGERSSYSILANLGVEDTVARTGREYVDLAVRLATDRPFASAVRAKIVAGLAHSALTDMPAHTRNLESAYVTALALRGEAPVPRAQ